MTKTTVSSLTKALQVIRANIASLNVAECPTDTLLDLLVDIDTCANEALNPVAGPSLMELKTTEVTKFIMGNFNLAFASNDDIGDALNAAKILSPAGKPWTKSNVSKVMVGVREQIVKNMTPAGDGGDEAPAPQIDEPVAEQSPESNQADPAPEVTPVVEELLCAEVEPISEPVAVINEGASEEDDLMAELDALDELGELEAIAA